MYPQHILNIEIVCYSRTALRMYTKRVYNERDFYAGKSLGLGSLCGSFIGCGQGCFLSGESVHYLVNKQQGNGVKRIVKKLLLSVLIIAVLCTGCSKQADLGNALAGEPSANGIQRSSDDYEASSALSDWILGTDYGIVSGAIDTSPKSVILELPAERLERLTGQDKQDIYTAIGDILTIFLSPADAQEYSIQYKADGVSAGTYTQDTNAQAMQESETVANLIFIHHSCGENWLNDGLCQALNDMGFHVADICYGWRDYGDHTDTIDWPVWFTDDVMPLVYHEMNAMTAPNMIRPAVVENEIILFKSCFPNSDVGSDITDEMDLYNGLLAYFEQHPDKMFVLVTPPPMIHISNPVKTRELCNWLYERNTGWLSGLSTGNVFVFDFYNVLTHPDAHHQFLSGQEVHQSVEGADTLHYDSDGDDHPRKEGNTKATREFIGLLRYWYQCFCASGSF